ncbi:SRPBCC domain-containing protein [Dictyobacter formicarum]|uniref:Vanillate O-demethylase oxidoreductase VanB n=1 Tax=Dictyobacter formicarum TaxID=2778368 RepID=A0ABQ3VSW4_9CHLR|nr:SRPBCC domain-containing protein [Dictyobacter formicarum]GHO89372.1 vanillate O-demethylase oxidoreductase VanB [Dictyobacter formicarum]
MTIPDCIERIEMLPVSRERVWDAITKPEQFSQWFDIVRDIDFRVGGTINFTWENELSPYPAVIEKIEPPQCFAFRWASYAFGHPELKLPPTATTLVTFTLEEVAEGTRLTVVESGFASLPDAFQAQSHQENVEGWQSELPKLRLYLQSTISAT